MIELLVGAIWRLGGAGSPPFYRWWRRAGWPILAGICAYIAHCPWYIITLTSLIAYGTMILPLTYKGDSVPGHWFNWVWLWILGYLYGMPSALIHGVSGLLYALVPCITLGSCVTLSNIKGWPAKTFVHEACEVLIGIATAKAVLGGGF